MKIYGWTISVDMQSRLFNNLRSDIFPLLLAKHWCGTHMGGPAKGCTNSSIGCLFTKK